MGLRVFILGPWGLNCASKCSGIQISGISTTGLALDAELVTGELCAVPGGDTCGDTGVGE